MKQEVLKLNKNFHPLDTENWKKVMTDIVSGAAHPIDVHYDEFEDGDPWGDEHGDNDGTRDDDDYN
jgi:hypothetical protein